MSRVPADSEPAVALARLVASLSPANQEIVARIAEFLKLMRAADITPEAGLDALERMLASERGERPLSPHQLTVGFDEQQGTVTGTCACGDWAPGGRYFPDRQVGEEFSEHAAAEAGKA